MSYVRPAAFLRRVLLIDAATSGAGGLIAIAAAGPLAGVLDLPAALLTYAGLSLIPFAILVAFVATRETLPGFAVWAVIGLNALWVVESIVLVVGTTVTPNVLGEAFIIAQAVAVAGIAELEFIGLRRSPTAAAA